MHDGAALGFQEDNLLCPDGAQVLADAARVPGGMARTLCKARFRDLTQAIGVILIVYSWVVAAILIMALFLIGRLYEVRFGQRSYYQLLLLPGGFFVAAAVWDAFFANGYTGHPLLDFVGGFWSDLLFMMGGIALLILCYSLFRTMMGGRG